MDQQHTILYVITSTNVGGTEKALYDLISTIDRKIFRIFVCSVKAPGAYAKKIADISDGFFSLNLSEFGGIRALINFTIGLLRLISLVRLIRPCILHAFLFRANIMGRIAGRLVRVPSIISSVRVVEKNTLFKDLIDRFTSSLTDQYIAVSDAAKNYTILHSKIPPQKIVTIYNGIDVNKAYPSSVFPRSNFHISEEDAVIALIGRFHKQKGHTIMIDALKDILPDAPHTHMLFAGEGENEEYIKQVVAKAALSQHIHFVGVIQNVFDLLKHVDILVLPSLWEGLPNVLLEAMAAAVPVVASRIGGIDEIAVDGKTGLLFTPGDSHSLSRALLTLLKDKPLAKRMGIAGKNLVTEKFQLQNTVQQTCNLYHQLLSNRNHQHDKRAQYL